MTLLKSKCDIIYKIYCSKKIKNLNFCRANIANSILFFIGYSTSGTKINGNEQIYILYCVFFCFLKQTCVPTSVSYLKNSKKNRKTNENYVFLDHFLRLRKIQMKTLLFRCLSWSTTHSIKMLIFFTFKINLFKLKVNGQKNKLEKLKTYH